MFKIIFYRGLTSGIIAATAAIIFKHIHQFATYTDFSKVVSVPVLIAVNVGVCMLAAVLFFALVKWLGKRGEIVFNILFFIASFASVMWSFAYILPLEIETPELFPGLTVPMHFFPALAWFALAPIVKNEI
jgi:hypothetical protein